ncbi:MerR family transcriptional regulator [Streptomyces bobili]|uniref:MerR family transcriptional regulator n=1 Tax=Streptomyces bobili TaxID=67280 RepID=UPI0037024525
MDGTTELLSISAFARRVGLAPSALRFYDDCRVLRPAWVDGTTGYRFYSTAQEAVPLSCAVCENRDCRWPRSQWYSTGPIPVRLRSRPPGLRPRCGSSAPPPAAGTGSRTRSRSPASRTRSRCSRHRRRRPRPRPGPCGP